MSENAVPISNLNDFVFCPASIYYHGLDADTEKMAYQNEDQLNGTAAHRSVDNGTYSKKAAVLQGISVCSEVDAAVWSGRQRICVSFERVLPGGEIRLCEE